MSLLMQMGWVGYRRVSPREFRAEVVKAGRQLSQLRVAWREARVGRVDPYAFSSIRNAEYAFRMKAAEVWTDMELAKAELQQARRKGRQWQAER